MKTDRERNPGSKFQFIYSPTLEIGDEIEIEEIVEGGFQDSIASDARGLTYGTLSSLTGEKDKKKVQKIQNDFVKFAMNNKSKYKEWYKAWEGFWKKDEDVNELKMKKAVRSPSDKEYKIASAFAQKIGMELDSIGVQKNGNINIKGDVKGKAKEMVISAKGQVVDETNMNEVKSDQDMVKDGLRYAKKKYKYNAKEMKELAKDTLMYIKSGEIDDQASMEAYIDIRNDEIQESCKKDKLKETIRDIVKEILSEASNASKKPKYKKGQKVNYIEWGDPIRDPDTMRMTGKTGPDKKYPDVITKVEYREYNAQQEQRWEYYLKKEKEWVPDYKIEKR